MTSKIKISLAFILCLLILLAYSMRHIKIYQNSIQITQNITTKKGANYILYWDSMWDYEDFGYGYGSEIFKDCPVKNCYTTKNRKLLPIEDFDALMFHGPQYPSEGPPTRSQNQVYIYYNLESPFNTPVFLNLPDRKYNWTMTYR